MKWGEYGVHMPGHISPKYAQNPGEITARGFVHMETVESLRSMSGSVSADSNHGPDG